MWLGRAGGKRTLYEAARAATSENSQLDEYGMFPVFHLGNCAKHGSAGSQWGPQHPCLSNG